MRRYARRLLLAPGAWPLHLLLSALVVPRAALLGEAFYERDVHLDWYPRAHAFASAVKHGLPPLWDLSVGFGQPLLGDPSAQVLYPTTWLAAVLPPWTVYTLFVVAHLALAGAGATRLARASGLRRPEAAVAGAAWTLSGPLVSTANLWHHFTGLAWMPWVVLGVHRVLRRPGREAVLALGLSLGLQVLAGSPDMVLATAGVGLAWAIGVARRPRPGRLLAPAAAGAAGVLLAAALSAGQWAPAVEMAVQASRRALPEALATQWSEPPAGLLRVVLPIDASGQIAYTTAAQMALFGTGRGPLIGWLYVGGVTLALAAAGLAFARRRRLAAALAAAALVAVLLALGSHAPFFALARQVVPGLGHLRYPTKAMVVVPLLVALLAGHGLAALRQGRPGAARTAGVVAAAMAGLLAAAAALFGPAHGLLLGRVLLVRDGAADDALVSAVRLLASAALVALAAAVILRWRGRRLPAGALAVVGCALAADLLVAHHDVNSTAPVSMLRFVPPVITAVDRSEGGRLYVYEYALTSGVAQSRLGREFPYAVAQPLAGIDPRPHLAFGQRLYPQPPVSGTWDVEGSYDPDLRGLQPRPLARLVQALQRAEGTPAHLALLRVGAVRTIVALHRAGLEQYRPGPAFPSLYPEPILTFGVPGALPRARAVGRVRAVVDEDSALAALLSPGFDPAGEVVIAGPDGARIAAEVKPGPATVRVAEHRADRVRLDVDLAEAGVVVLADAFDPGWRAWVDGRPTAVFPANLAFRAVALPAGRHRVEMRYRPASVAVGLAVGGAGLAAALALALAPRRRVSPAGASTSSAGSR